MGVSFQIGTEVQWVKIHSEDGSEADSVTGMFLYGFLIITDLPALDVMEYMSWND